MRRSVRTVLAAIWTGLLVLTVVAAVDVQERTRYERDVRDDTREQLDVVRSNLDEALDRRIALADRLALLVALDGDPDNDTFGAYAASMLRQESAIRSLHLVPNDGPPLVHPADARSLNRSKAFVTEPRLLGPFGEPGGTQTLLVSTPVLQPNGTRTTSWGSAHVEVYMDPLYGEAKILGWPGDAVFAIRGTDGGGAVGEAFIGSDGLFDEAPVTALVSFAGGQWQVGATPSSGWPETAPASWWIRIGGGLVAGLAAVLVGVLVSEPDRLRRAVTRATQAANENEARFRSVTESAQDAILTIDDDSRLAYVNHAAETLYRFRADEVLGRPVSEVLGPECALIIPPRMRGRRERTQAANRSVEIDTHRSDGDPVPVEVSTASWRLDGRRFVTAIIRDVSERRRAQAVQNRLAAVLDSTPDIVCITGPEGEIRYLNESARDLLGVDTPTGRNLAMFHPEDARVWLQEEILPAVRRTGAWRGEGTLVGSQGPLPVSQIFVAHHGPDGKVESVAMVARDITEELAAREALGREKERFQTLSEAAFEGIAIHERGQIIEANAAFARMFGYTREELIGLDVLSLVGPGARDALGHHFLESSDETYEMTCLKRDGTEFDVELAAKDFPFEERIVRVVAVRDITERKKAEAAQRVALERLMEIERLKEVDQFKTQLLNTASHELNTPITPIRLQLYLLKNRQLGDLSEKHLKAIDVLDRNVERLALLVKDVLDVARLQSGRLRMHREPLDLDAVVREAIEAFEEPARQVDVALTADVAPELWVFGDDHRLTQVLFNLLNNALKFTPAGGRVHVRAAREGDHAVVHVADSGAGLSREQAERLFRPFTQVHDTMECTRSGTGLGLYISKGIVDEHDGGLAVASPGPGQGSTFTVRIPLAARQALERFDPEPPSPTARSRPSGPGPHTPA